MKMIRITVKLFATLARFLPESAQDFPVEPGTRVEDLIRILEIPREEAKLIFVNGAIRPPDYRLAQGDRVGIFPPVGGG